MRNSGVRGVCLIAITYVYFLIFAQFAFLARLAECGIAGEHLNSIMAAMAAGGVLLSLLTPRVQLLSSSVLRLRLGLTVAGIAALLACLRLGEAEALLVAFLIGAGLGLLTVTLVSDLMRWIGDSNPLLKIALGTGVGYLLCNLPQLFTASATAQAITAAVLCGAGIFATTGETAPGKPIEISVVHSEIRFPHVLLCFTALVWLDSAAFYIIQHTEPLKAGTWQGSAHLWMNARLHFGGAMLGAVLLKRKGVGFVLCAAFLVLAAACLLLLDPQRALTASLFYPIGVSLYSVALVAYPSLLASPTHRGIVAGWLYAVAGWVGSALGIGMGKNLGHIPVAFVIAAGAAILLPPLLRMIKQHMRECLLVCGVLLLAFAIHRLFLSPPANARLSAVERGRRVYISEGCIHCHSQYVRPHTQDVEMWGPVMSLNEIHQQRPPLIGNRRQGPDLAEVGLRRSPLWLKAHLFDPAGISGNSIMPSYAFLFHDKRGDDLVAYLTSLHPTDGSQQFIQQRQWRLPQSSHDQANLAEGEVLFDHYCSNCHAPDGQARLHWKTAFLRLPPVLNSPREVLHLQDADLDSDSADQTARIIKFGIPGTDMAGHEYLGDREIASLSLWLSQNAAQSKPNP